MLHAFELFERQCQWLRYTVHGELAVHLSRSVAVKFGDFSLIGDRRILGDVEQLWRSCVLIEFWVAEIDRCCVDRNVDRAALRLTVDDDGAQGFCHLAAPYRHAIEVIRLKARKGVGWVDL